MSKFRGYEGNIKFDVSDTPTAVGQAHVWGLTITGDTVECTDFSSTGWKEFLATLKSWTVTGEAYWDEADTAQAALRGAVGGAAASLELYIDADKNYYGEAIVNSWVVGAAVDGVVTASFALQGTGAPTYEAS